MQMSQKKKHNPQSHKSIEYSQTFTDEDLTVLLKKSEIVLNGIRSNRLHNGKEQ
jgi:hypothetical protein